jgi:colanic acid/amylovoran biosynthesis glycosyltransferase
MNAPAPTQSADGTPGPEVVLLFTRFPYPTETFLQREVAALRDLGVRLRLVSLWGGATEFDGMPVERFNRWRLFASIWRLPLETWRTRGGLFADMMRAMVSKPPHGWLNFWENLLGLGYGVVEAHRYRRERHAHLHAVWASSPAAAAWTLWRLTGVPYSMAAHAYDLYENGGDWLLREKIALARFVRTSTGMAAATLRERGTPPEKLVVIRRGLDVMPEFKALRPARTTLRIVCVARLVEKKGLERQLELYAAARDAGLALQVRIYGGGPLHARLTAQIRELELGGVVGLLGHRPLKEIFAALAWADVLVHTGIVARSGDRDGLPNVIPEAMAAGTLVVTSPAAATTEAISHEHTGLVAPVEDAAAWIDAWRRLASDDALCERLRGAAREWVQVNFDAHRNAARLIERIRQES